MKITIDKEIFEFNPYFFQKEYAHIYNKFKNYNEFIDTHEIKISNDNIFNPIVDYEPRFMFDNIIYTYVTTRIYKIWTKFDANVYPLLYQTLLKWSNELVDSEGIIRAKKHTNKDLTIEENLKKFMGFCCFPKEITTLELERKHTSIISIEAYDVEIAINVDYLEIHNS